MKKPRRRKAAAIDKSAAISEDKAVAHSVDVEVDRPAPRRTRKLKAQVVEMTTLSGAVIETEAQPEVAAKESQAAVVNVEFEAPKELPVSEPAADEASLAQGRARKPRAPRSRKATNLPANNGAEHASEPTEPTGSLSEEHAKRDAN